MCVCVCVCVCECVCVCVLKSSLHHKLQLPLPTAEHGEFNQTTCTIKRNIISNTNIIISLLYFTPKDRIHMWLFPLRSRDLSSCTAPWLSSKNTVTSYIIISYYYQYHCQV